MTYDENPTVSYVAFAKDKSTATLAPYSQIMVSNG